MHRSNSTNLRCTVDWLTPNARLAAVVLWCRATASRYFRSFQSNMGPHLCNFATPLCKAEACGGQVANLEWHRNAALQTFTRSP